MAKSQNGWSANDRSVIASYSLPGGKVSLRKGDVSVILLHAANRWHNEVGKLEWPGIWGYAERPIRGSTTTLSNHASGTAIDCNAPKHPLGVPISKCFTAAQIKKIREIVKYYEGVIRWGGEYSRPDGMHLEINKGASEVKRIADKIRNDMFNATVKGTVGTNASTKNSTDKRVPDTLPVIRQGDKSPWVGLMQKALNFNSKDIDENFGPGTKTALVAHQTASKIGPDGVCGQLSWASLISRWGDLQIGSKNPGVEIVQNFVGFRGKECDGDFGPATKARVQAVQRWAGLSDDGVVGNDTRKAFAGLVKPLTTSA